MPVTFSAVGIDEGLFVQLPRSHARLVLEALAYDPAACVTLAPEEILPRIARVRRAIAQGQGAEFTHPTRIEPRPGGMVSIHRGVNLEHLLHTLSRLESLALAALAAGATIQLR